MLERLTFQKLHHDKGTAIVLSDFFDPNWQEGVKALLSRGYQIAILHVLAEDEIKPNRKEAIKVLADAQIAATPPHAEDVKSRAKPGILTSKQTLKNDRPRKGPARRGLKPPKRQKH